jgi:hypothetical protein
MERTIRFILTWDENLDSGSDSGTSVDDKVMLTIDRLKLTPEDAKKLMDAQRNMKAQQQQMSSNQPRVQAGRSTCSSHVSWRTPRS